MPRHGPRFTVSIPRRADGYGIGMWCVASLRGLSFFHDYFPRACARGYWSLIPCGAFRFRFRMPTRYNLVPTVDHRTTDYRSSVGAILQIAVIPIAPRTSQATVLRPQIAGIPTRCNLVPAAIMEIRWSSRLSCEIQKMNTQRQSVELLSVCPLKPPFRPQPSALSP